MNEKQLSTFLVVYEMKPWMGWFGFYPIGDLIASYLVWKVKKKLDRYEKLQSAIDKLAQKSNN